MKYIILISLVLGFAVPNGAIAQHDNKLLSQDFAEALPLNTKAPSTHTGEVDISSDTMQHFQDEIRDTNPCKLAEITFSEWDTSEKAHWNYWSQWCDLFPYYNTSDRIAEPFIFTSGPEATIEFKSTSSFTSLKFSLWEFTSNDNRAEIFLEFPSNCETPGTLPNISNWTEYSIECDEPTANGSIRINTPDGVVVSIKELTHCFNQYSCENWNLTNFKWMQNDKILDYREPGKSFIYPEYQTYLKSKKIYDQDICIALRMLLVKGQFSLRIIRNEPKGIRNFKTFNPPLIQPHWIEEKVCVGDYVFEPKGYQLELIVEVSKGSKPIFGLQYATISERKEKAKVTERLIPETNWKVQKNWIEKKDPNSDEKIFQLSNQQEGELYSPWIVNSTVGNYQLLFSYRFRGNTDGFLNVTLVQESELPLEKILQAVRSSKDSEEYIQSKLPLDSTLSEPFKIKFHGSVSNDQTLELKDIFSLNTENDPCNPSPCENKATCEVSKENDIDSYQAKCLCLVGYIGERCHASDPCYPNPCLNNGTCESIKQNSAGENQFEAKCTCPGNYIGNRCKYKDWCEIEGNPICSKDNATCVNKERTFVCECENEDKYFDYVKGRCKSKFKCLSKKCPENSKCNLQTGSCECIIGFRNIFELTKPPNTTRELFCTLDYCSIPYLNDCQQNCILLEERNKKFECECSKNFLLNPDGKTCKNTDLKSGAKICTSDCKNGICDAHEGICECNQGFKRDTKTGACTEPKCPQVCNQNCEVVKGRVKCKCTDNEEFDDILGICKTKDACKDMEEKCSENEICKTKNGLPSCECLEGYIRDDQANNTCIQSDLCKASGKEKECFFKNAKCKVRRKNDTHDEPVCFCKFPLIGLKHDSDRCALPTEMYSGILTVYNNLDNVDIPKRGLDTTPCTKISMEENILKSLIALFNDSLHSATIDIVQNARNNEETSDYEVQILFKEPVDIYQMPERCVNQTSECFLPPMLYMKTPNVAAFSKNDFCSPELGICPPNTDCIMKDDSTVNCICKRGYRQLSPYEIVVDGGTKLSVSICEDIDECKEFPKPCGNNTKCINYPGRHECQCVYGHVKADEPNDHDCIHACDKAENPCGTTGDCTKAQDGGVYCQCYKGYKGVLCREADKELIRTELATIVVGCVLGSIIVLAVIGETLVIRKFRKNLQNRNPPKP